MFSQKLKKTRGTGKGGGAGGRRGREYLHILTIVSANDNEPNINQFRFLKRWMIRK